MWARVAMMAGVSVASVVATGCTPAAKPQPRVLDVKGAYNPEALDPAAPQAPQVPTTPPESLDPRVHPAGVDATPAGPRTYTVAKGDTLFGIAKTQYGNGNQWQRIVDANPGLSPTKMSVGQQIVLP